jgi:hypothetical protein
LGNWIRVLVNEKTEEDVEQCKEEGEEVPEDWYKNQWVR